MEFFAPFRPCLVGSVLYGTATEYCAIALHVFADEFETVSRHLIAANIHYRIDERTLRVSRNEEQEFSLFSVTMGVWDYEIVVMPTIYRTKIPLSPLDGKIYLRADKERLEEIIDSNAMFKVASPTLLNDVT